MKHPREALALRAELNAVERAQLEAHVASCEGCRGLAQQLEAAHRALGMPEPFLVVPPMRPSREKGVLSELIAMTAAVGVLLAIAVLTTMAVRDTTRDGAAATPPPSSATPPATPAPTPTGWPARTVADVSANLPRDPNLMVALRALTSGADPDPRAVGRTPTLGTPLFVRGLRPTDARQYLVPVLVDDRVIAVMRVAVDAQDRGTLVATRGWSIGPSFPAHTAEQAQARAASSAGPATDAELVWAPIPGTAAELAPFWRIMHASGRVSYVFEDGTVQAASEVGIE